MKQPSFIPRSKKEHGGSLSLGKRRSRRPLDTKAPLHVTLRSDFATGKRSLLKHKNKIERISKKAARLFGVKIYERAVCGNHLHFLIRGKHRDDIQNFFRVFAGHIAQEILEEFPLADQRPQKGCKKNQRKFWDLLIYTRILTWGREFKTVKAYIVQNTLEALHIVAYKPRTINRSPGLQVAQ